MRLHDRKAAGQALARRLENFSRKPDTLILALPRGGVPVAYEIARSLRLPLDVFLVRKLGLPQYPEVAMGAVASGGVRVMNAEVLKDNPVDDAEIEAVARKETEELARREAAYRGDRPYPALRGKTVIVVDDGLATGASMRAALTALRREGPRELICAVPVAAPSDGNDLPEADAVFALMRPEPFHSVGLWYERFEQVSDKEVQLLLKDAEIFAPDAPQSEADALAGKLRRHVTPLTGKAADYDELMVMAENARFVLIGEASHGTHEFYKIRADITKRLINEKGFSAVAVEADWPDAFRVNRYVRGDRIASPTDALSDFKRFPQWMWRNKETRDFIDWLHDHNASYATRNAGFYGLDLYSLNTSVDAVIGYLEGVDPIAAKTARNRYGCFDAFDNDPQRYGYMTGRGGADSCEDALIAQLRDLQKNTYDYMRRDGALAGEEFFSAEQNARLVKNAEHYYRAMFRGRPNSWNIRDTHMADTLDELDQFLSKQRGRPAKIVVWAHNSHIGDARATGAKARGELNLGQLVRQRHPDESLLIGFSTYHGTVMAADDWDEPRQVKTVRRGLGGSVEELFHKVGEPGFLLNMRDKGMARHLLKEPRLARFIGVIYRPDSERVSHYVDVVMPEQFDAVLHIDETRAVSPLVEEVAAATVPQADETYPTGL
ncbi:MULTISPECIES: erythromycin esterase family protein [Asticcacaulis]|uniref:erythromycin esterase family protein n=1 Tax=Asticcacaulis TaxID=76890 RepID=UPI001AE7B0B1|nr:MULTISPECIES: erythromycin esterase family protein [Asticcacaulis]MBP2159200.1 erythromycin esterase-like protein/predicted phosphoribosyltransferase [Asticcacaulis solisilvae]MDR6800245.1 erythromycin esterase-like protein/predicted phosphoribosyltransferase [Asticcacaulis sp. BE141]